MSELHPPAPPRRHLLSVRDLSREDVERILETARAMAGSLDREVKKLPTLRGRTVVNLFYESSTRTLASFELAAKRLSADTMSLRAAGSSVDKGESLKDTALTLAAYDPDVIVVRHPAIGAPRMSPISAREQGSDDDPHVLAELDRLNHAYEEKFGFRFVVFVNRREKAEILGVLRRRISRTREEELTTALDEFVSIAEDRYRRRVEERPTAG